MARDVSEANFGAAVLERSRELPVVVDFWADWCAPCRTLGPTLERVADARAGEVELVKVDTDANKQLSTRYGIQGIPAVKAFRDGEVVDEFVGAQPQAKVERFIDGLIPSEADGLAEKADEQSLRRALELEPGHADAAAALGRMLLDRGDTADAVELLDRVPDDLAAQGLAARARLLVSGQADASPTLASALGALTSSRNADALAELAQALEGADDDLREQIRRIMVGLFNELGADHELSREYRKKLAAALY